MSLLVIILLLLIHTKKLIGKRREGEEDTPVSGVVVARRAAHQFDGEELRVGLVAHNGEDVGERPQRRDAIGGRVALDDTALRQTQQPAVSSTVQCIHL